MKSKNMKDIIKEINNLNKDSSLKNYITGDDFETWLKTKKQDSINNSTTFNLTSENFIGRPLIDFTEHLNNNFPTNINFYSVSGFGSLSDYRSMNKETLNRKIIKIDGPMGDYTSWIYLEEVVPDVPNYYRDYD